MIARRRRRCMLALFRRQALDLSGRSQWARSTVSRPTSPTRLPPARWSSGPASVVKELVENAIDAGARPRRDSRRARRQEAGPRRGRRRGDGAGGCAAGDRAPRDQQDPPRRRSGGDSDARVPRRGAAVDRVGVAFRAAHARARARQRHRDSRQRRRGGVGRRSRRRRGHRRSRSTISSTTCRRGGSSSSPTAPSRRRCRGSPRSWRWHIPRSASR